MHWNSGGFKDKVIPGFPYVPNQSQEFNAAPVLSMVFEPTGGVLLGEERWWKSALMP